MEIVRPDYPEELELTWLRRAIDLTHADTPELACDRVVRRVAELSDLFTLNRRPGYSRYAAYPAAQVAYGLYFFPQTYLRVRFVLAECAAVAGELPTSCTSGSLRLLDLGAGSGAACLAAVDWLAGVAPTLNVHWTAVDRSGAALAALERLTCECPPVKRPIVRTVLADVRHWRPDESADLVLAVFVGNELFEDSPDEDYTEWLNRALGMTRHGGWLVVIEPALRAVRLDRARDRLLARRDVRILGPCPHHRPCPLLAAARATAWCHDVRRWNAPLGLRWINRRLHRDISVVAHAYLVVQRAPPLADPQEPTTARLVGPIRPTAGRILFRLCCGDGAARSCEILTRHLAKDEIRWIREEWERGDRVRVVQPEILGNGAWRAAAIERLAGFGPVAHTPPEE